MKVLLVLVLLFFVVFFPSWGLQAVTLLLACGIAMAWLYVKLINRAVSVGRQDQVLRGHRHERLAVRLRFENRGPLPIHFCLGRDHDAGLAVQPPRFFRGFGPWERRDFTYQIQSNHRGEFQLGPIVIRGSDPMGLFRWEKRVAAYQRVIIYPRILKLDLPIDRGLPAGNLRTADRIYEDVTRYRSLREYVPGDDPRRIAWKASARLGSLHTMEYLPALFFPVLVVLNLSIEDYPERNRYNFIERAVEVAASLVGFFSTLDQEIGMVSSGSVEGASLLVPVRGGTGQAVALLEALARIAHAAGHARYAEMVYGRNLRLTAGGRVCVVGPAPTDDQRAFLASARTRGFNVELFMIGAGADAPRQFRGVRTWRVREYGEDLIERF